MREGHFTAPLSQEFAELLVQGTHAGQLERTDVPYLEYLLDSIPLLEYQPNRQPKHEQSDEHQHREREIAVGLAEGCPGHPGPASPRLEDMMKAQPVCIGLLVLLFSSPFVLAGEIHDAARSGELQRLKEILRTNATAVSAITFDGSTPLHEAVRSGNKEIVAALLQAKADPELADRNGMTPVKLAKGYKRIEILELLESAGNTNSLPRLRSALVGGVQFTNITEVKLLPDGRVLITDAEGMQPVNATNCQTSFLESWGIDAKTTEANAQKFLARKERERQGLLFDDDRQKFAIRKTEVCQLFAAEPFGAKEKIDFEVECCGAPLGRHYYVLGFRGLKSLDEHSSVWCLIGAESLQLKQVEIVTGFTLPDGYGYVDEQSSQSKLDDGITLSCNLVASVGNEGDKKPAEQWLRTLLKVSPNPRERAYAKDFNSCSLLVVDQQSVLDSASQGRKYSSQDIRVYLVPKGATALIRKNVAASANTGGAYQRGLRSFLPAQLVNRVEMEF